MRICLSDEMAGRLADEIEQIAPGAELVRLLPDGTYDGDPERVNIFCFSVDLAESPQTLGEALTRLTADGLEWVQSPGAGYELQIWTDVMNRGVRLTTASGVHSEPIAQYILTYVLHWHRQVALHRQQQADRVWEIVVSDDLTSKTLGIVGYGAIGGAAARVAKAFGMRVVALRRTPIDDPNVDVAFVPSDLHELLDQSDYVVLSLPLNEHTRHTIGAAELAAMRSDAVLINVARGGVIDEAALVDALQRKAIRGATLDVVTDEPLATDSPLWDLENCVLTPHDAGYSPRAGERLGALFLDNLARFARGDSMQNEIHP